VSRLGEPVLDHLLDLHEGQGEAVIALGSSPSERPGRRPIAILPLSAPIRLARSVSRA